MTTRLRRALLVICCATVAAALAAAAGAVSGTDTITTIAGNGTEGFSGDGGQASAAQLKLPFGVAVDAAGNVFIADGSNHRVRKVTPSGVITTVAGTGTAGFSGDNGPATAAQLSSPIFVAVDGAGNLYISDQGNNRVRKVTPDGTITTVAGRSAGLGLPPPPPGTPVPATSVLLNLPTGIAVDGAGNLYIADQANRIVRKVSGGMITTVAGLGPEGNGGEGRKFTFTPCGLAVDSAGNLYIGEVAEHRVSKLTNGVLTTIVGTGTEGFSGDGGPATAAQLNDPCGVAVDSAGNLYIADTDNERVRKVAPDGVITTVAGTGDRADGGDNGPAANANLRLPRGVAVDKAGNLYIADTVNSRVRKVTAGSAPAPTAPAPTGPGAPAAVAAEIDAVTSGTSRLGKRVVRLELTLEENVSATLTLVRKGTTLATKRFAQVKAGDRTLILPVAGGVASGKATLRIALTDADGNKLTARRPVRVPPAD